MFCPHRRLSHSALYICAEGSEGTHCLRRRKLSWFSLTKSCQLATRMRYHWGYFLPNFWSRYSALWSRDLHHQQTQDAEQTLNRQTHYLPTYYIKCHRFICHSNTSFIEPYMSTLTYWSYFLFICVYVFWCGMNRLDFSVFIIPRVWTVWVTAYVCNKERYRLQRNSNPVTRLIVINCYIKVNMAFVKITLQNSLL